MPLGCCLESLSASRIDQSGPAKNHPVEIHQFIHVEIHPFYSSVLVINSKHNLRVPNDLRNPLCGILFYLIYRGDVFSSRLMGESHKCNPPISEMVNHNRYLR